MLNVYQQSTNYQQKTVNDSCKQRTSCFTPGNTLIQISRNYTILFTNTKLQLQLNGTRNIMILKSGYLLFFTPKGIQPESKIFLFITLCIVYRTLSLSLFVSRCSFLSFSSCLSHSFSALKIFSKNGIIIITDVYHERTIK